jgi:alkanesulfonate monooxygenase SsuD/methylene tetrahydromethanopterin reductase-like flavin-dependent oxidoreductase (luciferase family)
MKPEAILTVSVICAETREKAEETALSSIVWSLQRAKGEGNKGVPSIEEAIAYTMDEKEKETAENMKKKMVIGSPKEVKEMLLEMQQNNNADELMIVTITYSPEDRLRSYELIAREMKMSSEV